MSYFIGLMSGTSGDGIDASLCKIDKNAIAEVGHLHLAYPPALQQELKQVAIEPKVAVQQVMHLDKVIAEYSITAIEQLLQCHHLNASQITAIGSHGHTLRHQPQPDGYSWQIGNAAMIANKTGINCVADFRTADIAAGGQGAPLVPAFHQFLLKTSSSKLEQAAILNIGGIANVSIIKSNTVLGFDTGPGNALLDEWIYQCRGQAYDKDGQFAAAGQIQQELLQAWLAHPYFQQSPPKSTGRELFQLNQLGSLAEYQEQDIAATLTQFTALSIEQSLARFAHGLDIYVCGGGVHNPLLMQQLRDLGKRRDVIVTSIGQLNSDQPLNPDYIESMAFAWLAWCRINQQPGNLPAATGATKGVVLGALHIG